MVLPALIAGGGTALGIAGSVLASQARQRETENLRNLLARQQQAAQARGAQQASAFRGLGQQFEQAQATRQAEQSQPVQMAQVDPRVANLTQQIQGLKGIGPDDAGAIQSAQRLLGYNVGLQQRELQQQDANRTLAQTLASLGEEGRQLQTQQQMETLRAALADRAALMAAQQRVGQAGATGDIVSSLGQLGTSLAPMFGG